MWMTIFEQLLEKIAGLPFGVADVWKLIARKPTTKAQSYDLNIVFIFGVLYLGELLVSGIFNLSIPLGEHFLLIMGLTLISGIFAIVQDRTTGK